MVILLMQNGKVPCGQNWPNVPDSFFLPLGWTLHRAVQYLLEYIYLTLQALVSYVNQGCGKRSTGQSALLLLGLKGIQPYLDDNDSGKGSCFNVSNRYLL